MFRLNLFFCFPVLYDLDIYVSKQTSAVAFRFISYLHLIKSQILIQNSEYDWMNSENVYF